MFPLTQLVLIQVVTFFHTVPAPLQQILKIYFSANCLACSNTVGRGKVIRSKLRQAQTCTMTILILIGSYFNRPSSTSQDALIFHKRDLLKPWTRRVRLTGPISMGHCLKQNDFTWRKMKQTVCIIAQFKSPITNNFKVSVAGGNMWIRSTIGSFSSSKRQLLKPRQFAWKLPKRNK